MRIAIASFVLSIAVMPVLHAQGIGAVAGGISASSFRANPLHQTNNPVTLVSESKTVQTLADGTHITRTTHETLIRDTLGRTRTEHASEGPPQGMSMRVVTVDDVVAGRTLNWVEASGASNKEYTVWEDRQTQPMRRLPPANTTVSGTSNSEHYHVVASGSVHPAMPRPHEEDLGMKDIQGVSCKASRITTVYPEGFFGNDRPITSTEERCFSQEFQRNLEETLVDPRSGTTTTSVTTLNRGEPDASLFLPPAGYTERQLVQTSASR